MLTVTSPSIGTECVSRVAAAEKPAGTVGAGLLTQSLGTLIDICTGERSRDGVTEGGREGEIAALQRLSRGRGAAITARYHHLPRKGRGGARVRWSWLGLEGLSKS